MTVNKDFFDKLRAEIMENDAPQPQVVHAANESENQEPEIVQIMHDIDSGKLRCTEVNWIQQLNDILTLCRLMYVKSPYVILLWGFVNEIASPTTRNDVLNQIIDAVPKSIATPKESARLIEDCHCLINVNLRVIGLVLAGKDGKRYYWHDEQKMLSDLAFIYSNQCVNAEDMVTLAEEMYSCAIAGENNYMLTLILRASRQKGRLSVDNIFDFAKNLYIAENFRRHLIQGKIDKIYDLPVLGELDTKLLKACFEEYIRLRNAQIKDFIENDLEHYGEANELECLEKLYQDEQKVVVEINTQEGYSDKPNSMYEAMWAPGRKTVLDIVNKFLKYLQNKINSTKQSIAAKQPVQQIVTQSVTIEQNFGQINSFENSDVTLNK